MKTIFHILCVWSRMYGCVEDRGKREVAFLGNYMPCCFETAFLTGLELTDSIRLTVQRSRGICLSPLSPVPSPGITLTSNHAGFSCVCRGLTLVGSTSFSDWRTLKDPVGAFQNTCAVLVSECVREEEGRKEGERDRESKYFTD